MQENQEQEPEFWDWSAERTKDQFKEWLLPHLMVGVGDDTMEQIREATRNWTRINMRVSINGIELRGSGERLLSRLYDTYMDHVKRSAEELIRDKFRELDDLWEGLRTALRDAESEIYRHFGIEPREW